jgi:hypothetical protein
MRTSKNSTEGTQARNAGPRRVAKPKVAGRAKEPKKPRPESQQARQGSKKAAILELLRRPDGATLQDLTAATGWNANSVRGFFSGQLGKKMGLKVTSSKREDSQRVYQLVQ